MPEAERKTILLVEDEPLIAMAERMTLERAGYSVITAGAGEKAVEIIEKGTPVDLILMDIDLGSGISGTVAADRILAGYDLPLAFLSSHTEPEIVEQTEGITSYGYIVKNSGDTVLLASIRMAFRLFEANMSLRRSEERFRLHAEKARDLIYRIELVPERRFSYVSPSAFEITGYTPDEHYADPDLGLKLVHPDDKERLLDLMRDGRALEEPVTVRWCRKDGAVIWTEQNNVPVYDECGTLVALEGIARDVTERKLLEETVRRSENLFSKVFDILPIGLWIAGKRGELIRDNAAGVAIWGAEPTVGQDEYGLFKARRLPSGEEIAPDDWALAHTVNKGETVVDELLEIDTFDGQKKVILNYTAPVLDEAGNVEAAIVVNQDVTSRYQADRDLELERRRFSMLLESFPGFIYLQAPDYSIRYANKHFIDCFGETGERPCYEIMRGRDEPCKTCPTLDVFRTNQPRAWEWLDAPDGKTYMIHDFPFIDSDGTSLVLVIGLDMTDRKGAAS